jgi:LPXTG-motif cell wall-anchored protein
MVRPAIRLACAGALLAVVMGASALAQPADKRTYFTFSGPVAMPGHTLPAGKYLFRLGDPTAGRRIVQVMSEDGRKPIGFFFSIPAQRSEVPENPEIRFMETARGMPAAVRTWWYPGERTGYEFIYPKEQARLLARGASQPVLTTQAQTTKTEETNTMDLTRVDSAGAEARVDTESKPAIVYGTGLRGEVADPEMTIAGDNSRAANRTNRAELPRTATAMPAVALSGSLAFLAGAVLWLARRRRMS